MVVTGEIDLRSLDVRQDLDPRLGRGRRKGQTGQLAGQLPGLTLPPTASKTWIEILANVQAPEVNLAGDNHVFTLSASYDDGTGALKPANGASFAFGWTGPAGSLVSPAASPCVAAAGSNTCLVTVTSPVGASGTITIDSVTLTVNGVTFTNRVPIA